MGTVWLIIGIIVMLTMLLFVFSLMKISSKCSRIEDEAYEKFLIEKALKEQNNKEEIQTTNTVA